MLVVLLTLYVVGSPVAGDDSLFSPLLGDCHVARSISSPLSTFFLLKKPNFIYGEHEIKCTIKQFKQLINLQSIMK